jgi:hypothetical protein
MDIDKVDQGLTRRRFLGAAAAAGAVAVAEPAIVPAAAPQPAAAADAVDWSKVRGFNYQPSFGSNGLETWIDKFDPRIVDRELGLGRRYFPRIGAVRLWLWHDAFFRVPKQFALNFEAVLRICGKHGLKAIPVLFNNWHSVPDFGGVSTEMIDYWFHNHGKGQGADYVFHPYLEAMLKEHGSDPRVLAWDLCNEPFNNGRETFVEWLKHTYRLGKRLGARQPMGVSVCVGSTADLQLVEPCSDVLMIHPYFAETVPWKDILAFAQRHGKKLLATECLWGSLDDAARTAIIRRDLGVLSQHGIGFLPHALHESYVADLHRPQYGPISSAGYMAFIHMDGSLRAGHDAFNEY